MRPKIIILLTQLRTQARGVMLAALWQLRRFVEAGFDAEIRLFEYVLDFDDIRKSLRDSHRLPDSGVVANLHEFLISVEPPEIRTYDKMIVARLRDHREAVSERPPDHLRDFRSIRRYAGWELASAESSGELIAEYYRPDGSVYLRALATEASMFEGIKGAVWYDRDGDPVATFEDLKGLWSYWLRFGVPKERPLVVIQEGQYVQRSGKEVFALITTGSNDYNFAVAHGATLANVKSRSQRVSPGWSSIVEHPEKLDRMVFLTDEQRLAWLRSFPDWDNTVTIPNECRVETFEYSAAVQSRFVTVTSLVPLKQIEHMIRAMRLVVDSWPGATLEVFGEGSQRVSLEQLTESMGLSDNVFFLGYAPDARSSFRGAVASLITSDREAFPIPVLESMAVGTPLISYDIDYGPRGVISNDVDGYLVERNNIEALAARMIEVLTLTKQNGNESVRRAALRRAQDFAGPKILALWLSEIDQVISGRSRYRGY